MKACARDGLFVGSSDPGTLWPSSCTIVSMSRAMIGSSSMIRMSVATCSAISRPAWVISSVTASGDLSRMPAISSTEKPSTVRSKKVCRGSGVIASILRSAGSFGSNQSGDTARGTASSTTSGTPCTALAAEASLMETRLDRRLAPPALRQHGRHHFSASRQRGARICAAQAIPARLGGQLTFRSSRT